MVKLKTVKFMRRCARDRLRLIRIWLVGEGGWRDKLKAAKRTRR